jgi:hypothetical protein
MSAKPTQRDRVLAFLRDAGGRGIHTHELRQAMIGNPSQRIAELEAAGHTIEHKRERRNDSPGTRYTLIQAADGGAPSPSREDRAVRDQTPPRREVATPSVDHPVSSLFGDEQGDPTPSAYDPFSEAA